MSNEESTFREYERELLLKKIFGQIHDTVWLNDGHGGVYDTYMEFVTGEDGHEQPEEPPLPELNADQRADLDLQIRAFENGHNPLQQRFWERAQQQRAEMQGNGLPGYANRMLGAARFIGRLARDAYVRGGEVIEALGDPTGSAQFEESMNEQG